KQARTITLILDGTSFPTVRGLTGQVFTITLPTLPPDAVSTVLTTSLTPAVALAATRDSSSTLSGSGSGLSSGVTLRTSSHLTVSLTPTTGGQAGAQQLTLSDTGGGDPPPEEELPALWKMLLQIWRKMQRAGIVPGRPGAATGQPTPASGSERKAPSD